MPLFSEETKKRKNRNNRIFRIRGPLSALYIGALLLNFVGIQGAIAEDEVIEEVIVTGSYLKRSSEDSAVPLTVLDKSALDQIGATDIKDIIGSLTFNSGAIGGSGNAFSGGDSSTGNANVNLRNLGSGSTLVLINGKRTVATDFDNVGSGFVDVQGLVPNIALERVEIVKDGASSLYTELTLLQAWLTSLHVRALKAWKFNTTMVLTTSQANRLTVLSLF
jgi:outer membrane receptor for ferrienterochelin and colicin